MKKNYEAPILENIEITLEDVIATSQIFGGGQAGDKAVDWSKLFN